jgi:hypothetical protein
MCVCVCACAYQALHFQLESLELLDFGLDRRLVRAALFQVAHLLSLHDGRAAQSVRRRRLQTHGGAFAHL